MKVRIRPEVSGQEHPVLGILQTGVVYEADFSADWLEEVKPEPAKRPGKGKQEDPNER